MPYRSILYLLTFFFCSSAVAGGNSEFPAAGWPQTKNPGSGNSEDCAVLTGRTEDWQRAPERNSMPAALHTAASESEASPAPPASVRLDSDLQFLVQRQSSLAQCILANSDGTPNPGVPGYCVHELLLDFEMRHDGDPERDIPIGRFGGNSAFFYESGMTIDADGAPNAYHPDNVGLDDLQNAGAPGGWEGLAKGPDGEPYIQGPDDPYPGYYVSATALADRSKAVSDPARYVDASKVPFIVLPGGMARQLGARPGDFAVVFNRRNGKSSYAIFGDVGPHDRIGEGSVALAENLGIHSDARNGGARGGIVYLVFPGSGNGKPRTIGEINAEAENLLLNWEASIPAAPCTLAGAGREADGHQAGN